ncbi:MAG: O-antigen ligase family protein [Candidatus Neomarinimicrobiota bacterium]
MVIKTPAILYLLDKKIKTYYKLFLAVLLFTVVSCLFIFLSRASFIAFVFVLLSYFLFQLIREQKINIVSTIGILLICFTSYVFMSSIMNNDSSNIISDRVTSIGINSDDQSISQRLRYYNHSLKMISQNFLTGIGIGNWKIESIKYEASNMSGYRVPYHAHNDFLQVFSESGIFAFLSFMVLIIYPLKRVVSIQTVNKEYIILSIMMGVYIIDSIFNFPIARPISHIFFLFLLVALTSKDLKNE